jgi:putative redox protein
MEAKVTWKSGLSFNGWASKSGFSMPLGTDAASGGADDGFRPMELLLVGLAGCTAMDVISILEKKKQAVSHFEVKVQAGRAAEHPRVFTHIVLEYVVTGKSIDPAAVQRAVELSESKYCSAQAMLKKAVEIESKITILEA